MENPTENGILKIKFFDKSGNEYNDMKFAPNTFRLKFK